jgi:putative tricarboxylic transport membrane protein
MISLSILVGSFMRRANIFISIVLIFFTIFYAYLITRLPTRNLPHTLGVDFMPWVLTICFLLLILLLLIENLFDKRKEEESVVSISFREGLKIISLIAIIILYIKVMILLGFLLVTPVFIAVLMVISGSKRLKEIIIFSIGITLAVYSLFFQLFNVPLPGGKFF